MFENPGEKIKKVSIIMFWIISIACVILACEIGLTGYRRDPNVLFFPLLIGGPLFAYITNLFLYGFGELLEKVDVIYNRKNHTEEV